MTEKLSAAGLLRAAVWRRKGILRDALLATLIVNILTLATSLFAMQVYDRVIPNAGFQTLQVLTTGVALAILIELLLRHLRGVLLDREGTRIDAELAEWFFARALAIRMEARPATLGTFAAQIKGLELVRGVMRGFSTARIRAPRSTFPRPLLCLSAPANAWAWSAPSVRAKAPC